MNVFIKGYYLYVQIPYADRHKAKGMYGTWQKNVKMWKFPASFWMMKKLLKEFPQLRFNPEFMNTGRSIQAKRQQLLDIMSKEDVEGHPRLRPYQRVDVEYLSKIPHVGIFNQPRTGKTPTSITLVTRKYGSQSVLTVCSKSLLLNWQREIGVWGDYTVFILQGNKQQRERIFDNFLDVLSEGGKAWLITTYRTATLEVDKLTDLNFGTMLVDEAHRLRNRGTQQSKALLRIGKSSSHRVVLTGTPTVKSKSDIFGILQFLYPDRFTNFWDFYQRYFITKHSSLVIGDELIEKSVSWNTWGEEEYSYNEETLEELNEILAFISIRRLRKDVMPWLPKVQEMYLPLELTDRQKKAYRSMQNNFVVELEDGEELDASSILVQLLRLRQITVDPNTLGIEADSIKTQAIIDILEERDNPTIIFSMFTSYLKSLEPLLQGLGYTVARIDGEITGQQRQNVVDSFQAGEIEVLLANPLVAGEGLTLNRADMAIFVDTPWNPSDVEQAKDRILPTTQDNMPETLSVVYLQAVGTVDDWMLELLKDKKSITDLINEGGRLKLLELMGRR